MTNSPRTILEQLRNVSPRFHWRLMLLLVLGLGIMVVCVGTFVFLSNRAGDTSFNGVETPKTLNQALLQKTVSAYNAKKDAFNALVKSLPSAPIPVPQSTEVQESKVPTR